MLTDHKVLNMGMTILLKVELEERLKKANQAMGMLKTVWNNNNFSVHTKIKIYKTMVRTISSGWCQLITLTLIVRLICSNVL